MTDLSTGAFQSLQQYCCACIPKQLCVRYVCGEMSVGGLLDVFRGCLPGDDQSVYRGEFPINGEMVEVEIAFVVVDEVCYLSLSSYKLGIDDSRVELTQYIRDFLCRRCQPCPQQPFIDEYVEWNFGDCSFYVSAADNTSLRRIPPCPECNPDDPCLYDEVVAEANQEPDTGSIETPHFCAHCGGCSCVCSCACITILKGGDLLFNGEVCLCNYSYQTANGYSVSIEANEETGCCELVLGATGDESPTDFLDNTPRRVRIDDRIEHTAPGLQCPNLSFTWEFEDGNSEFPFNHVIVMFSCMACAECSWVTVNCCGEEGGSGQLPKILTATVSSDVCCGFELKLIYDQLEGAWLGSNPTARCGSAAEMRLACSGGGVWRLSYKGGSCVEQIVNAEAGSSCSPVSMTFTVPAQGLGCCQPDTPLAFGDLTIEVTE